MSAPNFGGNRRSRALVDRHRLHPDRATVRHQAAGELILELRQLAHLPNVEVAGCRNGRRAQIGKNLLDPMMYRDRRDLVVDRDAVLVAAFFGSADLFR
ncbi:MAG: hypothetical protein ACLPKB_20750 [Xanthobacteraceae bacterium]